MVPGKLNLLSRWPGEGLGGVVALEGLDVGKGAGEEGVEEVVDDGLLLESRWFMAGGCSCRIRAVGMGGAVLPGPFVSDDDLQSHPQAGWRTDGLPHLS